MAGRPVDTGEDALRRGDWDQARKLFARALAKGETAESLDGMARAQWWLADPKSAVTFRARAFGAYRRRGDTHAAARIAWWLVREYGSVMRNPAAANGWLTRCQRLLHAAPPGPAHGWLELARTVHATDVSVRLRHAEQAYRISRQFDDTDLEVYALAQQGLARIATGQVTSGIADLDEAIAAAADATLTETMGDVLCTGVEAAESVGDAERFDQWNEVLQAYMSRHHHIPLYGFCFTCCGEVSVGAGRWDDADDWFSRAISELERTGHHARCAHPVARLAQLRIRQGRLADADRLLAAYRDLPETVEPLATLLLAQGQPAAASHVLHRRLAQLGDVSLPAVPLLSLLVQARTAEADLAGAEESVRRLRQMAQRSGLDRVRGLAALAAGRVAREHRHPREAADSFENALTAFDRARMPLEVAVTHRELARLHAEENPQVAVAEARAALHGFTKLGARRDIDETTALLRSLGVRGRTGPKGVGQLSQREREVLELVAEGLTNAEIAARLFISTKTAGNHVSNVLMKLGVRSRTEAAAQMLREPAAPP